MIKVFSVFDVKSASFGQLIQVPATGIAVRTFTDVCNDAGSPLAKHPGDYALFELGEYDPASGKLVSLDQPKHILAAASVVSGAQIEDKRQEVLPLETSIEDVIQRVDPSKVPA